MFFFNFFLHSQRTLSFNSSSSTSSSRPHPTSSLYPLASSSSTSSASSSMEAANSSNFHPLLINVRQSDPWREEEPEVPVLIGEEDGNDNDLRRRSGNDVGHHQDSDWRNLQQLHLHPDYSISILDDTINRPSHTMQHIMSRTIAGESDPPICSLS